VTDREARLAKNEALFRGVNEKVREVKGQLGAEESDAYVEFICECGRADCVEQVPLTRAEYERVRSSPVQFVLTPGHEIDDVEGVVDRNDRYVVVEKHPEEATVARATDPRS
jgi:hypothetical protein